MSPHRALEHRTSNPSTAPLLMAEHCAAKLPLSSGRHHVSERKPSIAILRYASRCFSGASSLQITAIERQTEQHCNVQCGQEYMAFDVFDTIASYAFEHRDSTSSNRAIAHPSCLPLDRGNLETRWLIEQ